MSICRSHDVTGFSAPQADLSRTAAYDFFDDRPHTEGYDWLLSNRHPKTDRCASNASGSPYKSRHEVSGTHPMRLCRVVAHVMSQAKLMRLIAGGALD